MGNMNENNILGICDVKMLEEGIEKIKEFSAKDFAKFSAITAVCFSIVLWVSRSMGYFTSNTDCIHMYRIFCDKLHILSIVNKKRKTKENRFCVIRIYYISYMDCLGKRHFDKVFNKRTISVYDN